MIDINVKEGHGKIIIDTKEEDYLIEDAVVDEGKYRTVVTISLAPKAILKRKKSKNE